MIIDANVSLDADRYPIERVLRVLSSSKIPRAVISAEPRSKDKVRQNAYVLEVARQHQLYPFYYVGGNPFTDTRPDTIEVPPDLQRYAGVRWHRYIGAAVDRDGQLDEDELDWAIGVMESPEFESLVAAAAHYNLPVQFEESFAITVEFVQRYPSLDIIVPHLGGRSGGEGNTLRAFWDVPNVYFDTSLALLDETFLARVGTERILFGSGFPYGDPEMEIDKIDRLPIPEEVKEGIYGDNIASLLSSYGDPEDV